MFQCIIEFLRTFRERGCAVVGPAPSYLNGPYSGDVATYPTSAGAPGIRLIPIAAHLVRAS